MKRLIKKNERGQAMVEFAIVLPILLLLLCGMLDFGWIYYNKYKVEDASYQGARYAFVSLANQEEGSEDISGVQIATETYVKKNLLKDSDGADITVDIQDTEITVSVKNTIKTLTFVGSTFVGQTYTATSTSVASK